MEKQFVKTSDIIEFDKMFKESYAMSPSLYKAFCIANKNTLLVKDFLSRKLSRKDLGTEVGSYSYIDYSSKYFVKTKALQEASFILDEDQSTVVPINPRSFVNMHLSENDLIISKDGNIGEVILLDRDYPDYMLSGALYKLPVKEEYRYYLFAFLKHPLFKEQIDYITPKGATLRHCKDLFLQCKIPMPTTDVEKTIQYINQVVFSIVQKEKLIKERHQNIVDNIETHLRCNQRNAYSYCYPSYDEMKKNGRMDMGMYSETYKRQMFLIENYSKGYSSIEEMGFTLSRGQNLQVSNIGESIYSKEYHKGFYTLMLPMFLSKYGTCEKVEYLGNSRELKTLKRGDLIFGAEGFDKGRSIVIIEEQDKAITNIHGITIQQTEGHDLDKAIFLKCFLDYMRSKGLIDSLAVGGNGGSLAQRYWRFVIVPNFPNNVKEEIIKLYHSNISYPNEMFTYDNFADEDKTFNERAGIYELDKSAKLLKRLLDEAIRSIANNEEVLIKYK